MKKILTILVFISLISFVGCAPQIGYKFTMIKPTINPKMIYSNDYISIAFVLSETWYKGVEGMKQYDNFDGISFILTNKTNEVMTIDWNKISFKDYTGSSGNAVMHKGIKYKDCSSIKSPTTIPSKGKLSDIIIPCYGVKFKDYGRSGAKWEIHMLPSPRKMAAVVFGIFIPIQIGDDVHNYEFEFQATRD